MDAKCKLGNINSRPGNHAYNRVGMSQSDVTHATRPSPCGAYQSPVHHTYQHCYHSFIVTSILPEYILAKFTYINFLLLAC